MCPLPTTATPYDGQAALDELRRVAGRGVKGPQASRAYAEVRRLADPRVLKLAIYFDISGTVQLAADSPIEEEFVWTLRNIGIDQVLLEGC